MRSLGRRLKTLWDPGGPEAGWPPSRHPCAPGTEEERRDLTTALGLVKELLSNVDQDVHELEKGARLQEIYHRMDPRAQTPVPGKGPFGREELLRRRLIHDGCLLWKTATGRFKGRWSVWQARQEPGARHRGREATSPGALSAALPPGAHGRENVVSVAAKVCLNSVFSFMDHSGPSWSAFTPFFGP